MQTQQIQTKRKWAQPPWTPERRAKHKAACQAAKADFAFEKLVGVNREMLEALFALKEKYGIEPREAGKFILLVPEKTDLSDDQLLQWRSMASQQIPAAEIGRRMFGG